MASQNEETLVDQVEEVPSDPWAVAFAALDKEDQVPTEADANANTEGDDDKQGDLPDTDQADVGGGTPQVETDDSLEPSDLPGGPGDLGGNAGTADEDLDWIGIDLSQEEIEGYRKTFQENIRNRSIRDVADAYIKKGVRNTNGRLGATINDPDICKRDNDGVPRFYNPDTQREFTGDNPRRQAQEWVDDYNKDLSEAFNKTCQEYEQQLMQREGGSLAIIEFAPKYKALDPVRRSMFESIIEDYEVTDKDGNIIAYSCDLDKALAAVNRQVRVIQSRFSNNTKKPEPAKPSGPALDTPSSGNTRQKNDSKPQFKSLAEAMEWEQDQLLEKSRGQR